MDDEIVVREITGAILRKAGYCVKGFCNGESLLEAYDEWHPELVIMDLIIPDGMGGEETIKKLLEYDSEAKAIVFSGHVNTPLIQDYNKYGFKGVLTKPFEVKELLQEVSRILPE